jgi:ABC-type polar amino acid transport system ATPase subunit
MRVYDARRPEVVDRVVMMDDGLIIEKGPPRQFFDAPDQERTQRFRSEPPLVPR